MKMLPCLMPCLLPCLLLLLGCLSGVTQGRTLLLNTCSVNVHTHELRKYYSDIRSHALAGDSEIGLRLMDKSMVTGVQEGQLCCFLRLVLRFYVERVFSNYASAQPQRQSSSALANAFISIRKEIHRCHCLCSEETQRKIDSLHAEFIKLEVKQAAQKAVGELDTVLGWLDGIGQKTQA